MILRLALATLSRHRPSKVVYWLQRYQTPRPLSAHTPSSHPLFPRLLPTPFPPLRRLPNELLLFLDKFFLLFLRLSDILSILLLLLSMPFFLLLHLFLLPCLLLLYELLILSLLLFRPLLDGFLHFFPACFPFQVDVDFVHSQPDVYYAEEAAGERHGGGDEPAARRQRQLNCGRLWVALGQSLRAGWLLIAHGGWGAVELVSDSATRLTGARPSRVRNVGGYAL